MSNTVIRTSKYKTKRRNYILLYYIVVKKKLQKKKKKKLHIFAELAKKSSCLFHQYYIIFAYTFCGYVGRDDVKTSNLHDLLYL